MTSEKDLLFHQRVMGFIVKVSVGEKRGSIVDYCWCGFLFRAVGWEVRQIYHLRLISSHKAASLVMGALRSDSRSAWSGVPLDAGTRKLSPKSVQIGRNTSQSLIPYGISGANPRAVKLAPFPCSLLHAHKLHFSVWGKALTIGSRR